MLTASRLIELLGPDQGLLAFTASGERVGIPSDASFGPATLLVSAPSDALKTVSDRDFIERSVDRDDVWAAEAFVLQREVIEILEGEFRTPSDIYRAVTSLGYEWIVSPTSSAP